MKELEMNWSKLTPELKDNVMDIMVDNILVKGDYDFKNRLLSKIGVPLNNETQSSFGASPSKSGFGQTSDYLYILIAVAVLAVVIVVVMSMKPGVFPKII
jgi:hypothetical protein